jgi:hypothetical protein
VQTIRLAGTEKTERGEEERNEVTHEVEALEARLAALKIAGEEMRNKLVEVIARLQVESEAGRRFNSKELRQIKAVRESIQECDLFDIDPIAGLTQRDIIANVNAVLFRYPMKANRLDSDDKRCLRAMGISPTSPRCAKC